MQVEVAGEHVRAGQGGQGRPGRGELGGGGVGPRGEVGGGDGEAPRLEAPRLEAARPGAVRSGAARASAIRSGAARVVDRVDLGGDHIAHSGGGQLVGARVEGPPATAPGQDGRAPPQARHAPGPHGQTGQQGVAEAGGPRPEQGAQGAQDVVGAPGQGRAAGPAPQPDDGPGVGRGEAVTVPAEQVGQDGRLVQAAGAPLPQVDLLEGDDVGVDVADLVGQGGQDLPRGPGVGDVRVRQRRGRRIQAGPVAGPAVLEVEAEQANHLDSSRAAPTPPAPSNSSVPSAPLRPPFPPVPSPSASKVRLTEFMQ